MTSKANFSDVSVPRRTLFGREGEYAVGILMPTSTRTSSIFCDVIFVTMLINNQFSIFLAFANQLTILRFEKKDFWRRALLFGCKMTPDTRPSNLDVLGRYPSLYCDMIGSKTAVLLPIMSQYKDG